VKLDWDGAPQPQASEDARFDWPTAWHQGQDDVEPRRAKTEHLGSDELSNVANEAAEDSGPPLIELEQQYSSAASESLPPVIEAFPVREHRQEPPPVKAADRWFLPWPVTTAAVAASLTVIVLVVVLIVVMLTKRGESSPSPTAAPSTTVSVPLARPPTTSSVVAAPPPPTVTRTPQSTITVTAPPPPTVTMTPQPTITVTAPPAPRQDPELASLQQLRAWANNDRPIVNNFAYNKWVPQLSSKQLGTVDHGVEYNYERILQDFLQLRQQYSGVARSGDPQLLWSGDWSTFDRSDYWITIAGIAYPTADGALAWCRSQGLDDNHCYAKLISTTHPIDGSTAHN
jgi:hypothetical protein